MKALTSEKRTPKQSFVCMPACVVGQAGEFNGHIRGLSRTGALLEIDAEFTVGAKVEIRYGVVLVSGRVSWSKDGRTGIEFDRSICWPAQELTSGPSVAAPRTYTFDNVAAFDVSNKRSWRGLRHRLQALGSAKPSSP